MLAKLLKKSSVVLLVLSAVWKISYASEINNRQTPVVKVVKGSSAAVVNISTERVLFLRQNPLWGNYGGDLDTLFDQFFSLHGMTQAMKLKSVGSGVIIDKSGLIVTNAHVVNMADSIYVILNDGMQAKGKVLYEDSEEDLALIKITPPKELTEAVLGQTKDLMLGETVVAIGNPFGLENTVTSGIVSGKNRKLYSTYGELIADSLLQIDAPINPGNSGGALFNLNGELIGINLAVVQYSQNIGFAIPVEKVRKLIEEYKRNANIQTKRKRANIFPHSQSSPVIPSLDEQDRDSWDEIKRMQKQMNLLMQDAFNRWGSQRGMFKGDIFYDAQLDTQETDDEYIYKINISDLNKDKINVEINRGTITVSGEYADSLQENGAGRRLSSQTFGYFLRSMLLPSDADEKSITSEVKDDVIIIRVKKKQAR
ncbi:MAG: trypsin-like peptidase domain-containing protein [Candidatus Omnitrophica bacterium]|nr:trypsin-like peptidase domain-containing protein [Candidatus Omnitrophota bacterium]